MARHKIPAHQQFFVGRWTIYTHDYDGDNLTLVRDEHIPIQKFPKGTRIGFGIRGRTLAQFLDLLYDEQTNGGLND